MNAGGSLICNANCWEEPKRPAGTVTGPVTRGPRYNGVGMVRTATRQELRVMALSRDARPKQGTYCVTPLKKKSRQRKRICRDRKQTRETRGGRGRAKGWWGVEAWGSLRGWVVSRFTRLFHQVYAYAKAYILHSKCLQLIILIVGPP